MGAGAKMFWSEGAWVFCVVFLVRVVSWRGGGVNLRLLFGHFGHENKDKPLYMQRDGG